MPLMRRILIIALSLTLVAGVAEADTQVNQKAAPPALDLNLDDNSQAQKKRRNQRRTSNLISCKMQKRLMVKTPSLS